MATPDFGTDISSLPDLDPVGALRTGAVVLAEAIGRRLITQRGTLVDSLNYGTDVRAYVNEVASSGTAITQVKAAIERECRLDERVMGADAEVWYDAPSSTMGVVLSLTTATGPFRLVLGVTSVTLQVLQTG